MSRISILKKLIAQHKKQMLGTYLLYSVEMIALLLRPFFLGIAINDLLAKNYQGLIYLALVHFVYLVVGTVRHMYDTRTYSAIYASLVTNFLSRKFANHELSKLSAHSNLAKEFVNFLETDLVYVIEALYNVIGALIMLCFYNPLLVWPCLLILIPVLFISKYYGKKMEVLYKRKNDELEKQVDIIASGNPIAIKKHYSRLRIWQIKISNQEAWNFGFLELLVIIVIGLTLMISANNNEILVGSVVGIYSYVLKFVSGLDTIPYTVERFSTLKDITKRIELQVEDLTVDNPKIGRVA
jgi:ABC-type bacteriocin/lantibiotic exporter with double-glycine peptidase domain